MKQSKIIQAYKATEELANITSFTTKDQWQIYTLRKALRPHVEFQQEREKALAEKYAKYADDKGVISGQRYIDYTKELAELGQMDVELDVNPIKLTLAEGVTFKTIEALEGFVEFEPKESE